MLLIICDCLRFEKIRLSSWQNHRQVESISLADLIGHRGCGHKDIFGVFIGHQLHLVSKLVSHVFHSSRQDFVTLQYKYFNEASIRVPRAESKDNLLPRSWRQILNEWSFQDHYRFFYPRCPLLESEKYPRRVGENRFWMQWRLSSEDIPMNTYKVLLNSCNCNMNESTYKSFVDVISS